MQASLWTGAAAAVGLAACAGLAERRRTRRRELDRVGWVPWPLVLLLAIFAAAILAALALRS